MACELTRNAVSAANRPRTEVHIVSGRTRTSLAVKRRFLLLLLLLFFFSCLLFVDIRPQSFVGHVANVALHAEHGLVSRAADFAAAATTSSTSSTSDASSDEPNYDDGWRTTSVVTAQRPPWMNAVRDIMQNVGSFAIGSQVEVKAAGCAFHYREVNKQRAKVRILFSFVNDFGVFFVANIFFCFHSESWPN